LVRLPGRGGIARARRRSGTYGRPNPAVLADAGGRPAPIGGG
jgi:hypothetical protein